MPLLSQLTAAGRSDLLPGHVLSQLRLNDLGAIEAEAEQQYRDIIAAAALVATDAARPILREMAEQYISGGNLLFGMADLDTVLSGHELSELMVFLSLRREHRRIDRAAAGRLMTINNAKPVKRFLLESLGFDFDKPAADDEPDDDEPQLPRPISWRPLFAMAHKRGVTQLRIGEMTYRQLDAQLRPLGGKDDAIRAERRVLRRRKRQRFDLFDLICGELGIGPAQLGMMDTADVAAAAHRTGKAGRIDDLEWLKGCVTEYVAERSKG